MPAKSLVNQLVTEMEAIKIAKSLEIGDLLINEKGHPMFLERKGKRRRFQYTEGSSNKYWEVEVCGTRWSVAYGIIGSQPIRKNHQENSEVRAKLNVEKKIGEYLRKGYKEIADHEGFTYYFLNPAGRAKHKHTSLHENDIIVGLRNKNWKVKKKKKKSEDS